MLKYVSYCFAALQYHINIPSELRVLGNEGKDVEVELDQAVVDGSAIPVLRDPLPASFVGELALFTLDSKEALQGCLVCNMSALKPFHYWGYLLKRPVGFSAEWLANMRQAKR